MSYNVASLGSYTQPNEKTMLVKSVLAPKTIAMIKAKGNIMTGVKTKSQLPQMDTDAVFQDGKACGFNASGTTKISKRDIEVGSVKVQEALCPSDIEDTFEQMNLTAGSDYTEIIFASDYSELKSKKIAKALEIAVWQGDTESTNVQLKRFDGFAKIIKAATGVIDANVDEIAVATGITKANVIDVLDAVYAAFPEEYIENEDSFIMVGNEVLRLYRAAMKDLNLYNYQLETTPGEMTLYGTNMKIIATPGLNGLKEIYGSHWDNLYFATDLLDEAEKFELKYAPEAEEVRFSAKFKAGVQIGFPDEVVKFILA